MARTLPRPEDIETDVARLEAEAAACVLMADGLRKLVPAARAYWALADGRRRARDRERKAAGRAAESPKTRRAA